MFKRITVATLFTLLLCTSVIAQTSETYTKASGSDSADEVIARLIAEVTLGRETVTETLTRIADLEAQLAVEQKNSASLAQSYAGTVREIEQLRRSNELLERAIGLHEKTITVLQAEDARKTAQVKKARKQAALATAGVIASVALRLLF